MSEHQHTQPRYGGSFRREKDGSLTRLEGATSMKRRAPAGVAKPHPHEAVKPAHKPAAPHKKEK